MTRNNTLVPEPLKETLDDLVAQLDNRKNEVVNLLSDEQPSKSRLVDLSYTQCIWWEGCYYCQDEDKQWHRIKCFI